MIPNSPNFEKIDSGAKRQFPDDKVEPPVYLDEKGRELLQYKTVGPTELYTSNGYLLSNYWVAVTFDKYSVLIQKAENGILITKLIYTYTDKLKDLAMTFDQLGRPVLMLLFESGVFKLDWYDPQEGTRVLRTVENQVTSVAAGFDIVYDTGKSTSDVLLFYVKDNQAFMLIQRDRYNIPYPLNLVGESLLVIESYLCVDGRYRVKFGKRARYREGWEAEGKASGNWVEGE